MTLGVKVPCYSAFKLGQAREGTMKRSKKVPFWFRRIGLVKAEMKTVRFPRTAQEGFHQCAELSETARRWFRESIRDDHPGASEEEIEKEVHHNVAEAIRFAKESPDVIPEDTLSYVYA